MCCASETVAEPAKTQRNVPFKGSCIKLDRYKPGTCVPKINNE